MKKQARTTVKTDDGNKCNVPGCPGMVGVYSERHGKKITRSNKIKRATKGTWLAASDSLLQHVRFHLPYKQSKERCLRMMENDLQILSTHWQASDLVKCVIGTALHSINRVRAIANLESESETKKRKQFYTTHINSSSLMPAFYIQYNYPII